MMRILRAEALQLLSTCCGEQQSHLFLESVATTFDQWYWYWYWYFVGGTLVCATSVLRVFGSDQYSTIAE